MELRSRRRGRPVKNDARRNQHVIRLSDKELGRVRMIADSYDISVNEAFRMMLKYYYENVF